MTDFLELLLGLRKQQAELLQRLEKGEFGVFQRNSQSMQSLKADQVAHMRRSITEQDQAIAQIETTIAQMTNAGHL